MAPEKISLTEEKATLLITLYGKAQESRLPDSLLKDRFAAEAVERIDYDFTKLRVNRDMMIGLALRAYLFDRWVKAFLKAHGEATVLHLACGLDSRVFRLAPGPQVRWFDVDQPEVISLRRRVYPDREGTTLIAASVTEPGWLEALPADRPTMVVAEGLMPYLPAAEAPRLIERLVQHFPAGEIAFDAYSRLGLKLIQYNPSIRATGARVHGSLEDPHDFERKIPGLVLLDDLKAYSPEGYDPAQIARMSRLARLTIGVFTIFPALGKIGRLLRYGF